MPFFKSIVEAEEKGVSVMGFVWWSQLVGALVVVLLVVAGLWGHARAWVVVPLAMAAAAIWLMLGPLFR
jgi:hypothetical protein